MNERLVVGLGLCFMHDCIQRVRLYPRKIDMLYIFHERFLLLLQTEQIKRRKETRLANVLDDIPEVLLIKAGNIQLISHRRRD